jgi:3-dehydroquinate synthase II
MKEIWVKVEPFKKELVTTALESGASGIIVNSSDVKKVKSLGKIKTISSEESDLILGKDVEYIEIKDKESEIKAAELSKKMTVIVRTDDWRIIPLENLIASGGKIFAEVSDEESAKIVLQVLEKGVDGIVINTNSPSKLKSIISSVRELSSESYQLEEVTIERIEPLGMSDRVCIDTTTNMGIGEGMLVGNSASCLFLVHSESIENPYVEPRPFRVNAGAVHSYVLTVNNRTKYLSELRSGDEVLIVNFKGETRISYVGRVKIEKRPMLIIEAKFGNENYSIILQNAETIRLTKKDGQPISVVQLKKGDKVLALIDKKGRHFGLSIEETITEK